MSGNEVEININHGEIEDFVEILKENRDIMELILEGLVNQNDALSGKLTGSSKTAFDDMADKAESTLSAKIGILSSFITQVEASNNISLSTDQELASQMRLGEE